MPYFENKFKTQLIITSYKVMYSSLKMQSAWKEVGRLAALKYVNKKGSVYHIVRNPYKRVVSYYENKLIRSPKKHIEKPEAKNWEPGQKLILNFLELENASKSEQANALLNLSFEVFISLIPKLWNTDHHLRPQYLSSYILHPILKVKASHIVKLEDLNLNIEKNLTLDFSIHRNKTNYHKPWEEYFTLESNEAIYKYYEKDFKTYGYKRI